ncbi:MAG: hypothetical protein R3A46_03035 [Thermomicrobiales bacterium]
MIWLVLALVVAFAVAQSLIIERLWRDQRRTRGELDELYEQVDALAVAVDRQVLTQEQIHDQIKPVAAAIREATRLSSRRWTRWSAQSGTPRPNGANCGI